MAATVADMPENLLEALTGGIEAGSALRGWLQGGLGCVSVTSAVSLQWMRQSPAPPPVRLETARCAESLTELSRMLDQT